MTDDILTVEGLKVWFPTKSGDGLRRETRHVKAVDGVDLAVPRGQTLGLVGESGCGKSTTGMALMRLVEPTEGRVLLGDTDVMAANRRELRKLRQRVTMVFQDPYASLNPRRTIAASVAEPLEVHGLHPGKQARATRVAELMEMVGLGQQFLKRHPHELSGGQRQRASHRPRTRGRARADRARRAHRLARRVRAGPGDEPALAAAARARTLLPVHRPRPRGRPARQRPGGGDVPRPGRRAGAQRQRVRRPAAPLHAGAAVRRTPAGPGARTRAGAHRAHRRRTQPALAAQRVQLPHPLPRGVRAVPEGRPGAPARSATPWTSPATSTAWSARRSPGPRVPTSRGPPWSLPAGRDGSPMEVGQARS